MNTRLKTQFLTYIKFKIPRKVYFLLRNLRHHSIPQWSFCDARLHELHLYYNKLQNYVLKEEGVLE